MLFAKSFLSMYVYRVPHRDTPVAISPVISKIIKLRNTFFFMAHGDTGRQIFVFRLNVYGSIEKITLFLILILLFSQNVKTPIL